MVRGSHDQPEYRGEKGEKTERSRVDACSRRGHRRESFAGRERKANLIQEKRKSDKECRVRQRLAMTIGASIGREPAKRWQTNSVS